MAKATLDEFEVAVTIKPAKGFANIAEINQAFEGKGVFICTRARFILETLLKRNKLAAEADEVDLTFVPVKQLCFDKASVSQFFAKAHERGLMHCSVMSGLQIPLQHVGQPRKDVILGMEIVVGTDGEILRWEYDKDEGVLCLAATCGSPDEILAADKFVAFAKPRKTPKE